jgi:sRNA-binding carbon storage regulator CsrA
MLVLSREKGQQLVISVGGEQVVVRLVEFDGKRARIGLIGREAVTFHREEVFRKIGQGVEELDELLAERGGSV